MCVVWWMEKTWSWCEMVCTHQNLEYGNIKNHRVGGEAPPLSEAPSLIAQFLAHFPVSVRVLVLVFSRTVHYTLTR
jgi:hypothetical protein